MAIGESVWQDPAQILGLKIGVAAAGVKYENRNDLAVLLLDEGTRVSGVFTQNAFSAAPVQICKDHLKSGSIRALLINSGNANACTGEAGMQAALDTCEVLGQELSVSSNAVLPFSTGVIGEVLPAEKISSAIPTACAAAHENNWKGFAEAIMTTDTRPKVASKTYKVEEGSISVSGVSKGAGMINPNMATMLAYVATDARVSQSLLDELSRKAANLSFNRITIDGDTSTNDSAILIATGKCGSSEITSLNDERYKILEAAVIDVYQSLAKQIVEDGEGATKFVTVEVHGGQTANESLKVAYAVAHSPLVKTALFASDPNWGRIVAAVGYADVSELEAEKIRVWLDDVLIVENGGRAASYTEDAGQAVFDKSHFTIKIDLGRGVESQSLWTTDLSHEYIRINAEYRS
ncbi:MAG: bifunctional glutamate N-acetyltransferase/amino-acid acetyltransferase ArgJ [Agarilytica sp.]